MASHNDATGYEIDRDAPEFDRADCRECQGTGSVRVLIGPDEMQAPCEACNRTGKEQTRDELANAVEAES